MKLGNPTISWGICFAPWFALKGAVPMQCMQSNVWLRLCRDRAHFLGDANLFSHCIYVFQHIVRRGPVTRRNGAEQGPAGKSLETVLETIPNCWQLSWQT